MTDDVKTLERILESSHLNDHLMKAIDELESEIVGFKKEQKEERFLWIISFIVFLDILFLKDCMNWSLPIIIGILELIIILILGQKFGIHFLTFLIDKILDAFKKNNSD